MVVCAGAYYWHEKIEHRYVILQHCNVRINDSRYSIAALYAKVDCIRLFLLPASA